MYDCKHKTRQLVALVKGGDASALDQLCRVYAERVRWMVRLRMGKELRRNLDSMDVVQDVLINALGGITDKGGIHLMQVSTRCSVDRLAAETLVIGHSSGCCAC